MPFLMSAGFGFDGQCRERVLTGSRLFIFARSSALKDVVYLGTRTARSGRKGSYKSIEEVSMGEASQGSKWETGSATPWVIFMEPR